MTGRISLVLAMILFCLFCNAQVSPQGSNLRNKTFILHGDSLSIDTVSIIPRSLIIAKVPPSDYRLDFIRSIIYFTKRPDFDTIHISYRVFPYKLNRLPSVSVLIVS
ncbi:MAG: hypothetical protein WDO19_01210 [Bacteroidota bacterium]